MKSAATTLRATQYLPTLRETQRSMAAVLMKPWSGSGAKTGPRREATRLIRSDARLTALDRLEIYSRSYWARVLDSLREDFPGLLTILGRTAFNRLATAYLIDCPSRSFTLRDLGSRLPAWLEKHPGYLGKQERLALDMARLEWAHIAAFDGLAEKTLDPEDLLSLTPSLRTGLQPYISLLELHYPVDELRVTVNAAADDFGTSSNVALEKRARKLLRFHALKPQALCVAVHRSGGIIYYRRLAPEEFRLLASLREGKTIATAIACAFLERSVPAEEIPDLLRAWFTAWATFGWLTAKSKRIPVNSDKAGREDKSPTGQKRKREEANL
jgi:hypothetical protein